MNEAEKQKIIGELKDFYKKLKSYNRYVRSKEKLAEVQIRYRDSLREKLVHKSGLLKTIIAQLTNKQYYTQFGQVSEIWADGLSPSGYLPSKLTGLGLCIDATNEAIGKLELTPLAELELQEVSAKEPSKAFISHGKRPSALEKLCDFLSALGIKPLVVEDQPSLDKTVDDKVSHYLSQADFVIILATGDDKIKSELYPRQNVIHEIGLAQNTHTGKIIYLLEERAQFPSNISPKVHARFTPQSMDRAFIAIARELTEMKILKAVKPLEE